MNRLNKTEPALHLCFLCSAFSADAFNIFFQATTALTVPCGGGRTSPRAANQGCYYFRSAEIVEHIIHI